MANQDLHNTYVERDRIETRESSGAGAFIIGGIVVALLVLIWLFSMGGSDGTVTTVPATGSDTVIIESPATPAAPATDSTAPAAPTADTDTSTGGTTTAPEATAPADVTEPTTVPAVPTAPSGN